MGDSGFSVRGRRVVVVGAARSGIAAAELLAKRGAAVTLTEMRDAVDAAPALRAAGVALELGGHRPETLAAADLVVLSPGVPTDLPMLDAARRRGAEVIGELELAWRWIRGPVIAVTGTKGKSTTTTLVGRMLEEAGRDVLVGGNIGVPLSGQVDRSTADTVHVVEASSFQLETTATFRPWIAVWLNFADDHLDRHPDVRAYAAAKARIFANQTADDWAVVNADDPVVMARSGGIAARRAAFALSGRIAEGFVVDGEWIVRRTATGADRLVPVAAVELRGRHMLADVLAATAAASLAGCAPAAMTGALRGFRGLAHVMEPAGEIGGVRFVNDSKATNVEAARRSIESFPRGVVAIVGGRFKGGDLGELREVLAAHGRAVIAIGEAAPLVRRSLGDVVPVVDAGSMREAVERGYEAAAPDGVVLLAPACASFDWFRDYAERGDVFKAEVARLKRATEHRDTETPS
ncbi:MAG: UDP-N-acetylmuramoyl-L-alanine--D-glutamate ligase [Acidobacteria bacterium]|nr:UDP-N-acetylmuramoyl-L-alanine--D-glutamate ligase [Acidobacteriota bacterium]